MDQYINAFAYAGSLLLAMLLLLEVGRRLGIRYAERTASTEARFGNVEGAVFALFGLLLAFTFSGAGARFDTRRLQIASEANAIGTAFLRLDLLASADQPALRQQFRQYLTARLEVYSKFPDLPAVKAALARSEALQAEIWITAVKATRAADAHVDAGKLLLPALNEMIDITTIRTMTARIHPPLIIYGLLYGFALGCALLAGYGMGGRAGRSWTHILGFVLATVVALYVILDLEYPRQGMLRIDAYDQVLVELRDHM